MELGGALADWHFGRTGTLAKLADWHCGKTGRLALWQNWHSGKTSETGALASKQALALAVKKLALWQDFLKNAHHFGVWY